MTLKKATLKRTICEVLREICDLHQTDSELDKATRKKLVEAERMAKKMSKKLLNYNRKVYVGWWEKNKDYEKDLKRRMNEKYVCE